jgi:hypothetical protein
LAKTTTTNKSFRSLTHFDYAIILPGDSMPIYGVGSGSIGSFLLVVDFPWSVGGRFPGIIWKTWEIKLLKSFFN